MTDGCLALRIRSPSKKKPRVCGASCCRRQRRLALVVGGSQVMMKVMTRHPSRTLTRMRPFGGSPACCSQCPRSRIYGTFRSPALPVVMCPSAGVSTGAHEFGHVRGLGHLSKRDDGECGEFEGDIMCSRGRREVLWQHIKLLTKLYSY